MHRNSLPQYPSFTVNEKVREKKSFAKTLLYKKLSRFVENRETFLPKIQILPHHE